ncbi:MAG: HAMP domain-containing protein [Candidatus Eisenbacteria bacterium]|nr:HAMP domain-containing protein [Candidatus Eisenbacteria bacterium]
MRKLRLQLIGILVLAVLLPLLPAAFVARELFRRSLDPLLETSIVEGAQAGLAVTREVLEREKSRFLARIAAGGPLDTLTAAEIAGLDAREQSALRAAAQAAPHAGGPATGVAVPIPPERFLLAGEEVLVASIRAPGGVPAWVTSPLPAALAARAEKLTRSIQLLETLRRARGPVIRGLEATFLAVYGAIVLVVLLVGSYLASRLTRPMAALGGGIERVAAGDLDTRVPEVGRGEIGALLRSFNGMVGRLRTQQAELVRLEKLAAWRQMSRRLAHEVKNPLTPIQLAAQEVRDAYPGDDPAYRRLLDESAAIIEEEVEGLRALVAEFSQFARLPEPQRASVDPAELLADVAALYGDEKLAVRVESGERAERAGARGGGALWCDREQMRRVLLNLVNNALAAQGTAGRTPPVEIVAGPAPDGGMRIRVLDRGPGVPESERRRIFEPDVTTKPDGMGLGLAIVESTIQSHGGTVAVADREGGGAEFVITLPPGPRGIQGEAE